MNKYWKSYVLAVFLFTFLGIFVFLSNPFSSSGLGLINSPLPDSLTRFKNNQVYTLALWMPDFEKIKGANIHPPEISAKAALVYDLSTEQLLYAKNTNKKLPVASLTKVMTAIIALENPKPDDQYFVRSESLVGENSMGLTDGEILTLEELLYGLILPSGNDAAETLANNFTLGRGEFIKAMNNKAKALGLSNTHFTNASGLQGDGDQYSTAEDLLVITRYAVENFPAFIKITSTFEQSIPYTANHKAFYLQNETNLLTSYPGVKGIKTGYTPEAGLCLITYLEHGDHKLIGIILGSNNRREEMKELLDYSLKSLGVSPPPHQ